MKHPTALLFALLALTATPILAAAPSTQPAHPTTSPIPLTPGDHLRTLEHAGRSRSYLLHVPPQYNRATPTPVVLIFHGAAMNARLMVHFCGLNAKSDEAGFLAVYPNGTGIGNALLTFNAWSTPSPNGPPDDVAFTSAILDDLATIANVDTKRIFATGMSNGGFMCYRLAAELSSRIAAVAPVAGTMSGSNLNPRPKRPVPLIHFHGTADAIVPYAGPKDRIGRFLRFQGVEDSIRTWVALDGCPAQPTIEKLPDTAHDGTTITRRTYGPGKDGAQVILYIIEAGGHTWPGRTPPVNWIGKSTTNISANDLIWDFFTHHPMGSPN